MLDTGNNDLGLPPIAENELENMAVHDGLERYRKAQEAKAAREGADRTDAAAKMIRGAIPLVSAGLRDWLAEQQAAKGRKPTGVKALELLDVDTLAYIGLSCVFQAQRGGGKVVDICMTIGRAIQVELEARALEEKDPKAAAKFQAWAKGNGEKAAEKRHARLAADANVEVQWPRRTQVLIGQHVLNAVLDRTAGLFVHKTATDSKGTVSVVVLTDEAAQAMAKMEDAAAWLRPALRPMVSKPRPWTSQHTGCYEDFRLAKTVPLVRSFNNDHRRMIREAIEDGSMQEVLDAVNAIQETHWAIDQRVLSVIIECREIGLTPGKSFPVHSDNLPLIPAKLPVDEWAAMPKDARSAMSRERRAKLNVMRAAGLDNAVLKSDLKTAVTLEKAGGFYLPHSLDFRGRVYAVPFFNHQRSDHMKALFRFAEAVELGADGGWWLAVHLANCGDFDKVSKQPFATRVAWVEENHDAIMSYARDPFGTFEGWAKADKPLCFLQACFEYAEWADSGFSDQFASTIAIAADGSCSGLQHYSAITRSEEEARHVNLTPRDDVGDIYQVVADEAKPSLGLAAASSDDKAYLAQIVLDNGFGRSEVKRNVMTYFYGSGKFGMRDQHMEDTMRPWGDKVALGKAAQHPYAVLTERTNKETGEVTSALDGGYSCAQVMAAHTYAAVVKVAEKADEAATWIQSVAATLAHESQSMIWRTPTGLPVVQRYNEYVCKRVSMWLHNREVVVPTGYDKIDAEGNVLSQVKMLIRERPTERVEKKRMRSAASPNVIHSMDGAHLQRTVARAHAEGIRHFAMIHDSFGTHAGNMTVFSAIIREAFVATYENYCPLEEIDRYARSVLSDEGIEKLPPIPAKGNLDLNLILESLYAFA